MDALVPHVESHFTRVEELNQPYDTSKWASERQVSVSASGKLLLSAGEGDRVRAGRNCTPFLYYVLLDVPYLPLQIYPDNVELSSDVM
ncbi:hypothetical protein EVAR_84301_1 [Eumeta japonica]|uniref:Uncharacterized protein n=1 Tax=Eumeta variegata TaxID=151549 RepID=A0A4C1ZZI5_EUMVA|nr:hypothetical protein EVAR_84301_1 [Eumeta japonica]